MLPVTLAALPEIFICAIPGEMLAGFRKTKPLPPPVKELAVIDSAAKFPNASRITRVPGAFVVDAAFAAMTPLAMFDADCPPTVATVVAACVPVTSPESGMFGKAGTGIVPLRFVAATELALPAVVAFND